MSLNPEPYTGPVFTLRYGDTVQRISDYDGNGNAWGFDFAFNRFFTANGNYYQSKYPKYYAAGTELIARFTIRNWFKEISAETPDQWIYLAMQAIAESAGKWEVILDMTGRTGFDIADPNKSSQVIDYGHTVDESVQDTPYGQLSSSSDYVSGRSNVTHGGKDTITNRDKLDAEIVMDLRDRWEDNMNRIVEGFDDLFIRIVGLEVEL